MNIDPVITQIDNGIKLNLEANQRLETLKKFCYKHAEKLTLFAGKISVYSNQIDFDYLDRPTTLEVIKTFPGKWTKRFNDTTAKVDYELEFDGTKLRCWASPPLESCKLIEETVTIPAQTIPAKTEKRFRLDCGSKSADDVLSQGEPQAEEENLDEINRELQHATI